MSNYAFLEIFVVSLISGFGMMLSGYILNQWKIKSVFLQSDPVWILVTPLIGLKGNLGMTLASRLTTKIKISDVDYWNYAYQSLIVDQIQGILIGFLAGNLGTLSSLWFDPNSSMTTFQFDQYIRLCFIGVTTAFFTSFILGSVTVVVVFISTKLNIDPDYVATPLAGAMGDTLTLLLIEFVANIFNKTGSFTMIYQSIWLLICHLVIIPYLYLTIRFTSVVAHIEGGVLPIIFSLILSSCSGFILKIFIFKVNDLSTFQPLINGIGGNVISVLCSYMSTSYHSLKVARLNYSEKFISLESRKLASSLLFVGISVHGVLLVVIKKLKFASVNYTFVMSYIAAVFSQITVLLIIFINVIPYMWHKGINPDNASIPLATGLGDLLGTLFLSISLIMCA